MSSSALNPPPRLAARRNRDRSDSHSSDASSHASHESHSSHSSYARRHPDRVPPKPPSINRPFLGILAVLALVLYYHAAALWLFTKGFLLTRVELDGRNSCFKQPSQSWSTPTPPSSFDRPALAQWSRSLDPHTGQGECTLPETHSKAVLLIIDALRYDFIAPIPPISAAHPPDGSPTWKPDPHYHAKLTLPSELHAMNPPSSFLAHFLADAPTTTLQRLKGLTTGTLPTFIEAGANFGGMGKVGEDNWLEHFRLKAIRDGARNDSAGLAFAGDDTWSTVFPSIFDADKTWSYDSFNVEDLDTVDRGVEQSLLPFLQRNHPDRTGLHNGWRLLVGHGLGVDHVGHRFGASHPKMATKMQEMQRFLRNVTDAVDDSTLVILMGDHGMDERGDHGGDGELEVGAGLWVWSRSGFGKTGLASDVHSTLLADGPTYQLVPAFVPFSPLPSPPFDPKGHRSIPQIDLVPSLSLLLGLPIPFNSLGSIVPELFPDPDRLLRALRINAWQIKTYLDRYSTESSDLAPFATELEDLWYQAVEADARLAQAASGSWSKLPQAEARRAAALAYQRFNRASLVRARSVWAQFELSRIFMGLAVLALSLVSASVLYAGCKSGLVTLLDTATELGASAANPAPVERMARPSKTAAEYWQAVHASAIWPAVYGAAVGCAVYGAQYAAPSRSLRLSLLDLVLFGSTSVSQLSLIISQRKALRSLFRFEARTLPSGKALQVLGIAIPVLHAVLFGSNSFTVWEDKAVLIFLIAALSARFVAGFGAPLGRLRIRMPLVAAAGIVLARLAAISRVCREEQAPYCRPTFYANGGEGGTALNSPYAIAASYVAAYFMPSLLSMALGSSKSNVGVAPLVLNWLLRPSLLAGAGYWLGDWAAPSDQVTPELRSFIEWATRLVARADLIALSVVGITFWIFAPLCLELRQEQAPPPAAAPQPGSQLSGQGSSPTSTGEGGNKTRVSILGYANSLGSSYLLLVSLVFSMLYILSQPAGQLALSLCLLLTVANAELGDCERDCQIIFAQVDRQPDQPAPGAAPSTSKKGQPSQPKVSPLVAAAEAASGPAGGVGDGNGGQASASATQPMPSFLETSTLALVGLLAFFSTGHQATLSSIQWRVAFIGFQTVTYPWSPLFVVANSFGPLILLPAMGVPLLCLWNLAPRPRGAAGGPMTLPLTLLRTSLGLVLYHALLATSCSAFAGLVFRRHLMLFKVWTPRFMLAAVSLVGTEVALLLALLAAWQTANKVNRVFGTVFA
ncbi:related to GPI13 - protein involved in glycosylphosphatidylinositol biosynthesis [Pseudozyma flocculosa]|uniref:Related to GPI13 - protein involved in glycosylphosphatidylinositol biosynthesis n=2 Tax=Pseudozyma flocculosa TaxID=84751 RepID=A0A5C3F969_9BASI|nr:related to GPI13 - protein involved in glycosylphosphatidylinositol biosynthesis [Pseudozyma flocculosa]